MGERPTQEEIRLECLRLAILDKAPHAELRSDRIIKRADEFYCYTMGIEPPKED